MNSNFAPDGALRLFEPGTSVAALPTWQSPRLLVPADSPALRWQTSSFYPSHVWRARAFRLGLRMLVTAGAMPARQVPNTAEPLLYHLQSFWPEANRMAVQFGAPGLAQTWTAEVRAQSGNVLGYVKGAFEPTAMDRLRAERTVLPFVPGGCGPELAWAGDWAGGYLLATTPIIGEPLSPHLPVPTGLANFADRLVVAPPRPLENHPWVAGLPRHAALDAALDDLSDRSWPVVVQHGDCAPWNLLKIDDRIMAFDWEFGEPEALPHLDEAYFVLQTAYKPLKWSPQKAADEAARNLEQRDLSPTQARALVRLAAFDAWRKAVPLVATPDIQEWRRAIWENAD